MNDLRNYSLRAHNTFGIDARCRRFVEYTSVEEARSIACSLSVADRPLLIVGSGSNLLLTGDFPGTVIHSAIQGLSVRIEGDEVYVRAGSGMEWDVVVARCVSNGWHGMENLSLIPGEVGASAVQNIGAYGVEACDIIYKVEAVGLADGEVVTFDGSDCHYGYRDSRFKHDWKNRYLITHVTYRLSRQFHPRLDYGNIRAMLDKKEIATPTAQQLRDVIVEIRRAKLPDPKVEGNAGSFFMNPVVTKAKFLELQSRYPDMPHYHIDEESEKIPAGWLIEQCGWKGRTVGHAGVHDKQALVLVNRGGATGAEVVSLCESIRKDVLRQFGIEIRPEVNIVGDNYNI
jgi:UDP-N-acetylmuramate dehydrogenase